MSARQSEDQFMGHIDGLIPPGGQVGAALRQFTGSGIAPTTRITAVESRQCKTPELAAPEPVIQAATAAVVAQAPSAGFGGLGL